MRDHRLVTAAADQLDDAIDALRTAVSAIEAARLAQQSSSIDNLRAVGALASLVAQVERSAGAAVAVREAYSDEVDQ